MKQLSPGSGAHGFSEREEPPLALGHVVGIRLFEFDNRPRGGDIGVLAGHYQGEWHDGENVATCERGHQVPAPGGYGGCGCGFWAYWHPADAFSVWQPTTPVVAVVEGYGPTRSGERGFRSQLARIVALNPAVDLAVKRDPHAYALHHGTPLPAAEVEVLGAALIEDILAERYPSAQIYSTRAYMLNRHPTTPPDWVPPRVPEANEDRRARWHGPGGPPAKRPISAAEAMRLLDQRQAGVTKAADTMACDSCLSLCPAHPSRWCEACRVPASARAAARDIAATGTCQLCGSMARRGQALCSMCNHGIPPQFDIGPGHANAPLGSLLQAGYYRDRFGRVREWSGKIYNA